MAAPKSQLYLWNGHKWTVIQTQKSTNALIGVTIEDTLGNPRKADLVVINTPYNRFSSNAAEKKGPHTDKFSTFSRILLVDDETHSVIFGGLVASAKGHYDPQYGDTIKISAFDYLDEARNHPASQLGEIQYGFFDNKKVIPVTNTGGGSDENETRQKQIEYLFTDENGINTELVEFGDKQTSTTNSDATRESERKRLNLSYEELANDDHLVLEAGNRNVLQVVASIANEDPHTDGSKEHQTYDYYVDPNVKYPRPTGSTTLPTLINASIQAFVVSDASIFLANDLITIDSEDMLITSISSNTLNVTRGQAGTTAASHAAGAVVTNNWITPNGGSHKQQFNYFRRGYRPNQQPEQFGLNINAPLGGTSESGLRPGTSPLQKARRFMLPASDWEDPTEQLFSHAVVRYNQTWNDESGTESGGQAFETTAEDTFELLYVYSIGGGNSGTFTWSNKKFSVDDNTSVRGVGASEYLSAYRTDGTTLIAANCAVIQYQSATSGGTNDRNGVEAIVISHVAANFPTSNYTGQSYVVLKGVTSGATCRFNADSTITSSWQGRPLSAWGVKRPTKFTYASSTNIDTFRKALYQKLRRVSKDIRRGSFQTVRGPYAYVEGRIATVSTVSARQRQITLKEHTGTTALNPRVYGVKGGMTIRFFSDANYTTETAVGWAQIDSYTSTHPNDILVINLRKKDTPPAVNDYFRIYVPIRAGDAVRVEHAAQGIIGNHLVLSTIHTEGQGRTDTMWTTVGENQDVPLSSNTGELPGLAPKHKAIVDSMRETGLTKEVVIGASNFTYETGLFIAGLSNGSNLTTRVSWTAGTLNIGRGHSFSISAGDSYTALGNTEMANNGTIYYIYFDRSTSTSTFQMIAEGSYVQNPSKLLIGWASYGTPVAAFNIFNTASPQNIHSGETIQGGIIRTSINNTTGIVLNHTATTPTLDIFGGRLNMRDSGGTNDIVFYMEDSNSNAAWRHRSTPSWNWMTSYNRGTYYGSTGIGTNVTVDGTTWSMPARFFAPGSNGQTYLGAIFDAGSSPNDYGVGWKALVLGSAGTDTAHNVDANNKTLVLRASENQTANQYVFTFPVADGSADDVLTTNGSGVLSWTAAGGVSTSTFNAHVASGTAHHTPYAGWIIEGVTGDQNDTITSGQTVSFHGSNGITTAYSASSNTLTIDGSHSHSGYASSGHGHGGTHTHSNTLDVTVNNLTIGDGNKILHDGEAGTNIEWHKSSGQYQYGQIELNIATTHNGNTQELMGQFKLRDSGGNQTRNNKQVGLNAASSSSYNLFLDGTAYKTSSGTTWYSASDDRIKTDINSITNAVDKLKGLNPIAFKYTDAYQEATGNSDVVNYSFLASNFGTVFPDFTLTTAQDVIQLADGSHRVGDFSPADEDNPLPSGATIVTEDIKSIDVSAVIPYLVAAIKELEARIATLEGG